MTETTGFLERPDGARLAWASLGSGTVLVKAANWLSHLEYDLESPIWRHWYRFFGQHYRLLRYDERGCGMTGRCDARSPRRKPQRDACDRP